MNPADHPEVSPVSTPSLPSSANGTATPRTIRTMRIAVLNLIHETVTFLSNDTTLEDFTYDGSPARGEDLLQSDPSGYIGGFVQVAREFDGVELVGIESPLKSRTGIGSGWVTREAYEHFVGRMIAELSSSGPYDGVYLSVHGAMAVRGIARPEAELAARVRQVVGPKVIIGATFDLHANEDEAFLQSADMAFSVKYYPHYDCHLQGQRCARMMVRAIRGDFHPTHCTRKVPIISPTVLQWTGARPWMDLIQRALVWEAREPDVFVNVLFGFPWSDVPDAGMTIQAITNGNPALAEKIVGDMSDWAWRRREALLHTTKVLPISEGVTLAQRAQAEGRTPVVLADHSDRSGAATWILQQALKNGMCNALFATITDGESVQALETKGVQVGDTIDTPLGGKVDASAGDPVRISGTVRYLGYSGSAERGTRRLAHVNIAFGEGNVLVLSRYLVQAKELDDLRALQVDPDAFGIIAIKSRVHFRRGFDDSGFAKAIFVVEPAEAFLGTVRLDGLAYENLDLKAYYPYADSHLHFDPLSRPIPSLD